MSRVDILEPEIAPMPVGDDSLYEIVDDRRVDLPPMATYSVRIAFRLGSKIEQFAEARELGRAITENLFRLRAEPKLQRRPDVAYVSFERWAKGRGFPLENAWDVIPDLVVEVVSPTDLAEEILTKIREYFEAGVRRAWVLYPHESLVYEYDSPRSIRILGPGDALEGGAILPEFRLPLSELFEGAEETGPS
jgi:Uma2 family endonuclease